MSGDTRPPIKVVMFGSGPVLTLEAQRFLARLEAEPNIHLLGVFCQALGQGIGDIWADLRRRRGVLAPLLFAQWVWQQYGRYLTSLRHTVALNRQINALRNRIHLVPDIHAPEVLDAVRALQPELGLIYGSPILKPTLFEIPTHGTLGIHHGQVPQYRGNKTPFWAMYNGEKSAGVTIQKINRGLDTGQIAAAGAVSIPGRTLGAVWRELEALGYELYIGVILAVRAETAVYHPQEGPRGKLYRNPKLSHLLRFQWIQMKNLLRGRSRHESGGAS